MAQHERVTKALNERADRNHRHGQHDIGTPSDQQHARDHEAPPLSETCFQPGMDEHVAAVTQAHSASQVADLVLHLQRTHGNSYVQRLLSSLPVQAKLTVSAPGDINEQEANAVADTVTRAISSQAQRQEEEEELLQAKPASEIHRQEEEEEEELQMQPVEEEEELQARLQRQEEEEELMMKTDEGGAAQLAEALEVRIEAARAGGEPLPEAVRASFEPQFERDFSNVRVHTDAEADTLTRQLQAQAFTTGGGIFFRKGAYRPDTDAGKGLLAHELTHVVQQVEEEQLVMGKPLTGQVSPPVQRQAEPEEEEQKLRTKSVVQRQGSQLEPLMPPLHRNIPEQESLLRKPSGTSKRTAEASGNAVAGTRAIALEELWRGVDELNRIRLSIRRHTPDAKVRAAVRSLAEKYEELANKATEGNLTASLNIYIMSRGLRRFVRHALEEHKPYLLPLLDLRASLPLQEASRVQEVANTISAIFDKLDIAFNIAEPWIVGTATMKVGAIVGLGAIAGFIYGALSAVAASNQAGAKLSLAMGVVDGMIGLAVDNYPPGRNYVPIRAKYQEGYETAKRHCDSVGKKGAAGKAMVARQLLAINEMGGPDAMKAIWPNIRDSYLKDLPITRSMFYNLRYEGKIRPG